MFLQQNYPGITRESRCTSSGGYIDTVNTTFPVTYELDYVKVWQPKAECNTNYSSCSVNESTYVSKIYKSITLGGNGCSTPFNNKTALSLMANDYVELKEGFQVGTNINLTIDVQSYCSDSMKFTPNRTYGPSPIPEHFPAYYEEIHNPN